MEKIDDSVVGGEKGTVPVCITCGSHLVMRDAWANWNPTTGAWELGAVFDATFCDVCGGETKFDWLTVADWRIRCIRALNDTMRQTGPTMNDRSLVTIGVAEKGQAFVDQVVKLVANFTDFTSDNDPNGEHDFGIIEVDGQTMYFKIDYYTPDLQGGSLDPAEQACTARVLTIMLASEY
jgi:hypothetical protein